MSEGIFSEKSKAEYRDFCQTHALPLFSQPSFLDCVAPWWGVILIRRDHKIVASMPIAYKIRDRFFKNIYMPPLAQFLGVTFFYPLGQKPERARAWEIEILKEVLDKLPPFDYFSVNFSFDFKNHLPFYWNGFSQSTQYSYVLHSLENLDDIFDGFSSRTRGAIRRAQKSGVAIRLSDDLSLLYDVVQKTYERQGLSAPIAYELLARIDGLYREQRAIFLAYDSKGQVCAGGYFIRDSQMMHYLIGGVDTKNPSHGGAMDWLIWEAIRFSANHVKAFNFEGSMNEGIGKFFSGFGGELTPYFRIYKTTSKWIKLKQCLSSLR